MMKRCSKQTRIVLYSSLEIDILLMAFTCSVKNAIFAFNRWTICTSIYSAWLMFNMICCLMMKIENFCVSSQYLI